jgi:hypothetical protein
MPLRKAVAALGTADADIRATLYAKRLDRFARDPQTLVIDELGLQHARCRIDVAVINGYLHGYEIKSARDSLIRFRGQVNVYRTSLQKLTFVVAPKHLKDVLRRAPKWTGVIEASLSVRGEIKLASIRPARVNPNLDLVKMSHLLWRDEAVALLASAGYSGPDLRLTRRHLYKLVAREFSARELVTHIREAMVRRRAWRDRQRLARCGD